jgi:putative transposase
MLWFLQMKSLQRFSPARAGFRNPFNRERHLISRETDKAKRSAAVDEWQFLVA